MPLTGEAKAAHNKAYYEKRRDAIRKMKREWYLKNEDSQLAKREEKNRKKFNPRGGDGSRAKRKVKVPKVRRWTIIEDESTGEELCYFNKETGYPLKELAEICDLLRRLK